MTERTAQDSAMKTINYYEIIMSTYHDTPQCQIRFENGEGGVIETSSMHTPAETTDILALWRMGDLKGSFAIGTRLADDARFILCEDRRHLRGRK